MINLIPGEAKKKLIKEYWLRSVTVWFFTWSAVLLLGIVLMLPSYVLVYLQVGAYKDSAATASQKNADFESVANQIKEANELAASIADYSNAPHVSSYIQMVRGFESAEISVTTIEVVRDEKGITPIKISGIATDRQSLAAFREKLLSNEAVESVDLPISNLAKDKEIPFDVTVTIDNKVRL